ncbi:hypothetical protein ACFPFV_07450 [Salinicoccus siamensis]|uniref:hypothetical protein n=1 Tax=Salinicoccus siamensis TaxID=381830 RepID=UPI003617E732
MVLHLLFIQRTGFSILLASSQTSQTPLSISICSGSINEVHLMVPRSLGLLI